MEKVSGCVRAYVLHVYAIIRPKLCEIVDARVDRKEQEAIEAKERDLTRFATARIVVPALKVLYHNHSIVVGQEEKFTTNRLI